MKVGENMNIIVAHPFQQHSFKTAVAVKKKGFLYKYVTTVYQKEYCLTSFITRFLGKEDFKRAKSRKCSELNDKEVLLFCEWANLLLLLLQRIDKKKRIYNWWYGVTIKLFNYKLFSYIKKNPIDAIIVYDTVSNHLIEKIKRKKLNVKIIVDMSAPNALYMRDVFLEEAKNEMYNKDIRDEIENDFEEKCLSAKTEIKYADLFLVASNFTRVSLVSHGVENSKIVKCVYGVYEDIEENCMQYKSNHKIKCCVLGKVCLQKGTFRLLNVIPKLACDDMEFHFYGAYDEKAKYYIERKESCIFHDHIPHDEMLNELKLMDVIIFPSFADGFGLSVTEALCRNVIAVCSKNAGVSELIQDGVNGYLFSPNDEEILYNILCSLKLEEIRQMQIGSNYTLREYTWDYYNKSIADAIEKIR